eukprot:TRINITY_DN5864_c0_g1_i1.p1 TRINITY_DN5864_c0_g1~~TRINITY_DN5864_c0_g1_i1.p1  ORF type:complete len:485 (+),score=82.46 TRINITY_DN5864_c0_g1_i1:108-1562(+)
MGKRGKNKTKIEQEDEEDLEKTVILLSSSDDEEANEDLSLKIVEKARKFELKRKTKEEFDEFHPNGVQSSEVIDLSSPSSSPTSLEVVESDAYRRSSVENVREAVVEKKMKKLKKKKSINVEEEAEKIVNIVKEEEPLQTEVPGMLDNLILRKLLRGPRYFDPLDDCSETCYNCGEEGHKAVHCTSEKRKKPCFVCGKFGHSAKHCTQGHGCFVCKRRGHLAKDCPEKRQRQGSSQNFKICLRCGDLGHDMSSCRNDYASEDLKEMKCYICMSFGHLCCADILDTGPREVSCYNCGHSGHTGLGCAKPRGETSGTGSPTLCYRCGEEGHFARGCTNNAKSGQWMGEPSASTHRFSKEGRDFLGIRSAPHDLGKTHKRKRMQFEARRIMTAGKPSRRGGWLTDDPGDFPARKNLVNGWTSPAKTPKKRYKDSTLAAGRHFSSSRSPLKKIPRTPSPYRSNKSYQKGFSASRFSNSRRRFGRSYDS